MLSRFASFLIFIGLVTIQASSLGATTYRYATVCRGDLYLIAADGKTKLILAKQGKDYWEGPAVSPNSGTIVASLYPDAGYYAGKLYRVDPTTRKKHLIPGGTGFYIPECPVWLNDNVLLLDKVGKDGLDEGVYAFNIRTGMSKQVVPPLPDNEFFYDPLIVSPSGRLVLTTLGITGGGWISVNDIIRGKSLWRTNPNEGMSGFGGVTWSANNKWLYVAFYKDDEMAASSPGGVWRFNARTGKQYQWKYAKQSIDGVYSAPKQNILVVEHGDLVDCLRMIDGKRLCTLSASKVGGVLGAFSLSNDRWILCGTELIIEMNSSGKCIKTQRVRGLVSSTVRFSPARNALMFGAVVKGGTEDDKTGVLDLKTGRVTRFAANDWRVEWLPRDVVR